jgi:hypothetical protein
LHVSKHDARTIFAGTQIIYFTLVLFRAIHGFMEKLNKYRLKHGLTWQQVSLRSGVAQSILSRQISGESCMKYATALKLQNAFRIRGLAIHIMNEQIGERK